MQVMHCETLQVYTKGMHGAEGNRLRRGPLGLGMPLGVATLAYARSKGCHTAEILAINDYGALQCLLDLPYDDLNLPYSMLLLRSGTLTQ
jgi:hypothetical protein